MRLDLVSSAFYIRHREVKYLPPVPSQKPKSGCEHRQANPRAHALASQVLVTMTGEIPILTEEEKTDKALSDVIFRTDKCCKENQSRLWDRVTKGRQFLDSVVRTALCEKVKSE